MRRFSLINLVSVVRHPSILLAREQQARVIKSVQLISDDVLRRARRLFEERSMEKMDFPAIAAQLDRISLEELGRLDCKLDNPYYLGLYFMVRWMKPRIVVETGVSLGVSSKFILGAMMDCNSGCLYSIDLPNAMWVDGEGVVHEDKLAQGIAIGRVVPEQFRSRWHLVLGHARALLPAILPRLEPLDLFLHDSEHSYEHMKYEFKTAWPHIRETGILVSDDADYNRAFEEFSAVLPDCFCSTFRKNRDGHSYGVIKRGTENRPDYDGNSLFQSPT